MKQRRAIYNRYLLQLSALIIMTLTTIASVNAETVSQKEAKERAQQFFNQAYKEQTAPVKFVYNGKRLTTDRLFTPFYVYNHPRGGFVIISAENKAYPILAYSLKSSFNPDHLSEGERGWLKNFATDIELIRYDSRQPDKAKKAWQNYPQYLANLLDAKYDATDPRISYAEASEAVESILRTSDYSLEGDFSAYFTPEQWEEMLVEELGKTGSVVLGFVDLQKKVYPAVAHGRKGDYFRLSLENRNDWLIRLSATEFLCERMVADLSNPKMIDFKDEEENPPFQFSESVMTMHLEDEAGDMASNLDIVSDPVVKHIGGGHFEVLLPENAVLAMLYNLNGSYIGRNTFKGTPLAHINLEAEPRGFYFALIYGESGRPYGIKLYR